MTLSDSFPSKPAFRLGFGLMRLPKCADGHIDRSQVAMMVDQFIAAGGTYFDTAYVYNNGESEDAIREALTERYPRDAYTLATKLNAAYCRNESDARQQFYTSLERTGAGFFDFYLLHALQRHTYQLYDKYRLWDFISDLKRQGLIRHCGFSFHADPELLEQLLKEHPEAEFVQLQINYADWEHPGVAARQNLEICAAYHKPVIVMEPVKGGILADPPSSVKAVFNESGSSLSYAGWAIRFAASLDNVYTVLSGMSTPEQMADNLSIMKNFQPLTDSEQQIILSARKALFDEKRIQCTGCGYCTNGCPKNIPIPDIFTVLNRRDGSPEFRTVREYGIVTRNRGRASDCIHCRQCEKSCPQHLPITDLLKESLPLEA